MAPEPDAERLAHVRDALAGAGLDALVCTLPSNVRMLSGYWPVIGSSIAIATRGGEVAVLVPEDERAPAERGWASVQTFRPASLEALVPAVEIVREPLRQLARALGVAGAPRVGFEGGAQFDPAIDAGHFAYGVEIHRVLDAAFTQRARVDATPLLERLRAILTPRELDDLRAACATVRDAFTAIRGDLGPGLGEREVAARLRARLEIDDATGARCGGFASCLSGPHAAEASAAFQESRPRTLTAGDLVLLHVNSYRGGMWTDVTRTFTLGTPDARQAGLLDAVLAARQAALEEIGPGVPARNVDRAARAVLAREGLGPALRHATGHGVGFAAIDPGAQPRIHPASNDVLEPGMVFNVAPAVSFEGWSGLRHGDLVVVTEVGAEVLTPFLTTREELALG